MNAFFTRRMRAPDFRRGRGLAAGGVLLVALIALAAGTVGIATWVSLMTARTGYVEELFTSSRRRVSSENSRSLATEYTLRTSLTASSGAAAVAELTEQAAPSERWGSFAMDAFATAPLASTQLTAGMNRFSPANNNYAYYVPLTMTLGDGDGGATSARFFAKSRSPLLSGDILTISRSAPAPGHTHQIAVGTSNNDYLSIGGTAYFWNPQAPHQIDSLSERYQTGDFGGALAFAPSTPSGAILPVTNFPAVPRTSGASGINLAYDGTLDVLDNPSNPGSIKTKIQADEYLSHQTVDGTTAVDNRGVTGDGDGVIDIDLGSPLLNNVLITDGVTTVNLVGQTNPAKFSAAAGLPAVMILAAQTSTNLQTVNFSGENNRRLYFAVRNPTYSGSLLWVWTEADDPAGTAVPKHLVYRLMLTTENVHVDFDFPGDAADVNLIGGIRCDRNIQVGNAEERISIAPELIVPGTANTAAFLERYADRVAWLETFVP